MRLRLLLISLAGVAAGLGAAVVFRVLAPVDISEESTAEIGGIGDEEPVGAFD